MNIDIIPAFLGGIRGWQLVIIVAVILLFFGGKKIPELMRGLGKGVHAFKQGLADAKEEIDKPINNPSAQNEDKQDKETPEA